MDPCPQKILYENLAKRRKSIAQGELSSVGSLSMY